MAITLVFGSFSHERSRSFPLTSALLPTDTNCDTPSPERAAASRNAMPKATAYFTEPGAEEQHRTCARASSGPTTPARQISANIAKLVGTPCLL
jgi:hypothetical protein